MDYSTGTQSSNSKFTIRFSPTSNGQLSSTPSTQSPGAFGMNMPPSPSRAILDPQYASRLSKSSMGRCRDANDLLLITPTSQFAGRQSNYNLSPPVLSVTTEQEDHTNLSTTSSSSSQFFTPERPRKSSVYNTPNAPTSSVRGFYTPQSSPSSRGSLFNNNHNPMASSRESITKSKQNGERKYSDRFIPSRATSNLTFSVWDEKSNRNRRVPVNSDNGGMVPSLGDSPGNEASNDFEGNGGGTPRQDNGVQNTQQQTQVQQPQPLLNALLRSELLGENLEPSLSSMNAMADSSVASTNNANYNEYIGRSPQETRNPLTEGRNFLRFNQSHRQSHHDKVFRSSSRINPTSAVDLFSLSPVGMKSSHCLMNMPQKRKRKIAKVPFKVLDAPSLADDFYLNLVDWSSLNVLAVGLGSCVYLWSACTSKVTKLCDLGGSSQESVSSVAWTQRGTYLAVGVNNGEVQIWDTIKCKKIRTMGGHSARIGALSWSGPTLASGSRDRLIYLRDVRIQQPFTARLASHKQEVCGLKWSFDEPTHLASGGNDNKLLVWDIKNHRQPRHKFADHTAAVKAIAWSPHQHGLLASGGGTADRCIRFWNALSGTPLNAIDTGSQVCNLSWSKNCNEIVSTHGYSLNEIAIWKYPTMQKVATLTGHTYRVLYLAMSPDGSTIVT
jgi:cell division cycle 20-like protein 1 (cofactor of APC complex)